MMEQVQLGRSGIAVPPVIFGCNIFGWTVDKAQTFRLLDAEGHVVTATSSVFLGPKP